MSASGSPAAAAGDVVFITAQYGNQSDTRSFVASVEKLEGAGSCEIIIVDNAATPEGTEELRIIAAESAVCVHLLSPASNLYYWGAAAHATQVLLAQREVRPDWVIVCNNDVTIGDSDFLTVLRSLDPETFPVIAPSIISTATGRDQNPFLSAPPRWAKRLKWRIYDADFHLARAMLFAHKAVKRIVASRKWTGRARSAPGMSIYAPHGAFVILSSRFFGGGGYFDTSVPLFAEELTLAVTADHLRLPVRYVPALRVTHREHSTTGAKLTRPKYELERRARRRYRELLTARENRGAEREGTGSGETGNIDR